MNDNEAARIRALGTQVLARSEPVARADSGHRRRAARRVAHFAANAVVAQLGTATASAAEISAPLDDDGKRR